MKYLIVASAFILFVRCDGEILKSQNEPVEKSTTSNSHSMTRNDLQDKWIRVVDTRFSNYQALTKAERVWFNVEPLITGGIVDHYINYGAEHNSDTIEDLETLNFNNVANIMRKMNSKFPNNQPSADIQERANQMEDWENADEFLEEIDSEFWKLSDKLEEKLLSYLTENGIG